VRQIAIQTAAGVCDAWLAQPEGPGPWPGVIFCMDAVGPREQLKTMAENLAREGYVVLLPNIFYRQKAAPIVTGISFPADGAAIPKILEQIMPLVEKFKPKEGVEDIGACLEFLGSQPAVRPEKFGIFGYCMGGALAIRAAAAYPDSFAAVASFHAGGLVAEGEASPHRLLPKLKAALYVGHADQDPHMSAEQIKVFDEAAARMRAPHRTETYAGAPHHFTMADLPAYEPRAAARHWERLLELFRANLCGAIN